MEKVKQLQLELSDSELRRNELEGQVRNQQTLLVQRQEIEQEAMKRVSILTNEKQQLAEKLSAAHKQINGYELEKRETERSKMRLEKDKTALKKTLDRVEREKLQQVDELCKIVDKTNVERQLQRLEEENIVLQHRVQELQAQLNEAENQHAQRLIDVQTRNRKEAELELERVRSAQVQCERQLESRERSNRQRIKALEEEIGSLRDQLSREIRNRQHFLTQTVAADEEIKNLHTILSDSITASNGTTAVHHHHLHRSTVSSAGSGDHPLLLELEARRLNENCSGSYVHELPVRHKSPSRRCLSPNKIKFRY